jgi:hypothetical protein
VGEISSLAARLAGISLKQTYARIQSQLRARESWDDAQPIGGALAIVVHSAYHLGEIRQALCTLKK